jgi:putative spermidine/putrescine transport system permease protein
MTIAQVRVRHEATIAIKPFAAHLRDGRVWLLALPAFLFFIAFFVIPVSSLFAISFNRPFDGVMTLQANATWANYVRIFTHPLYASSIPRSLGISVVVSSCSLLLGYPLAYVIAKTTHPMRNACLMSLVLASMQLDTVIRLYGLMVLLGDNGLINQTLLRYKLISSPLPLMYNLLGVVLGLIQITLPFMVLSLIGVIKGINPSLEEAARSLGASRWRAFRHVVMPLSMPGILSGSLLVFSISISSYVVPALMGGWKVMVLPIHIFQQISEMGRWQFGAAISVVLFTISLAAILAYRLAASRLAGGRS